MKCVVVFVVLCLYVYVMAVLFLCVILVSVFKSDIAEQLIKIDLHTCFQTTRILCKMNSVVMNYYTTVDVSTCFSL